MIFRKGLPIEAPTCYSAVKIFEKDSSENLNALDDLELQKNIALLKYEVKQELQKSLCEKILERIIDQAYLVPTGRFDLAYLIRPDYQNFKFNRLGFLDLSDLSLKGAK